ncbi:molybdopterin-binding protein [Allocoprobacillus halotolerans]|uniref:Molybdopterin-binding protein n=1 Tax=Allocoprobacillus halotolerans TaxID=2944914 RepID=A0ABY5I3F0_9FIRM|nr:molybdopterin-binding protein [Allocoprobacillus halotolerans]UTY39307.1 molybdopterin-binding protein [Allocoprobacillus halotolerans]
MIDRVDEWYQSCYHFKVDKIFLGLFKEVFCVNVEIINVGTELLLGEIVNTNATLLQKVCKDLGFNVYYQSVVGDNPQRLYDCLKIAFERGANCVMTTGGLGPTTDDLTKELSAKYLGLEMVYHEDEALKVEKKCRYCTGISQIPDNNFKQAYYPENAYILENDMGTANGCVMFNEHQMIINLPGPPKELKYVVEHALIPYLQKFKQDTIYTYEYMTMFIGESKIDEILRDLINEQEQVSIALYAGEETVRIRLAVKASSLNQAHEMMKDVKAEIEKRLSEYIIHEKDLKAAIIKMKPSLQLTYENDFRFDDDWLQPFIKDDAPIHIHVKIRQEELGEVVCISINEEYFEIPTFVAARYSYAKVEARWIGKLYQFMMTHTF